MKKISILGSTGSIGRQTLEVCRWFPDQLQVVALAAAANLEQLAAQAREFKPQVVALADQSKYRQLSSELSGLKTEIVVGAEAAQIAAELTAADTVVAAIAGTAGLASALAALNAGKELALANKEVLVTAGPLVKALCQQKGLQIKPVDSEHSAISQCLQGEPVPTGLILTASGGPFRELSAAELATVTAEQALRHPTWQMGTKVTVDSASLANKGLEVIEAHYLFGLEYDKIEVVIHPQSIVHSAVRFADGSLKAQLAAADMRLAIQYALLGPDRLANPTPPLDLVAVGKLEFSAPDLNRFPALGLAYQAGRLGGSYPTVFNAANELLGQAFLAGQIAFPAIGAGLAHALEQHQPQQIKTLEDVLAADFETRHLMGEYLVKNIKV